jgi:tetratricopeptide (TPR) repeat protein
MLTSSPLRIILFIGIVGLALFELRLAVIAQSSFSGVSRNKAIRKYQQDPGILVAYGRQSLLESGGLKRAEHWYRRALLSNPFYIPAWLALGELRNDEGDTARASAILEYVDSLTRDVARWRWDKAMLAYQLDRQDILTGDLSWLLQQEKVSSKTKKKAVKLAFSLWPDPEQLLDKMGTANLVPLFRYAVRIKDFTTAGYLWSLVDKSSPDAKKVLPYINRLINSKHITVAAGIWKKYFPADTLLYNGSFSAPVVNSGFGWRIRKLQEVTVDFNSDTGNGTGLHLHFNGKKNLNYAHISQIIALSSGHDYELSGQMRSKELSTDQKPFIEITGVHCTMPPIATEMVQKNQDWTPFTLTFTVPDQCEAVLIRIRRKPSKNIDNLLKGDLWVKDFALHNSSNL